MGQHLVFVTDILFENYDLIDNNKTVVGILKIVSREYSD